MSEEQSLSMQDLLGAPPNGTAAAMLDVTRPTPLRRVITRRMKEATIDQEPYVGFTFKWWANFPHALYKDMNSGDRDKQVGALTKILHSHNMDAIETVNDAGEVIEIALPQPTQVGFWEACPDDLAGAMLVLILRETQALPNSLLKSSAT